MVALDNSEARREPDYHIATERSVSVLLSGGQRITGSVRIYRPEGFNRLSDWARQSASFRYIETNGVTLVVNITHVIEIHEVSRP